MNKRENSRSDVQKSIEKYMLEQIRIMLNDSTLVGDSKIIFNDGKTEICPDIYSEQNRIIGEIHAHIGRLKGSQPDKIASDILKMLLYEKKTEFEWKKYIAICDIDEYEQLRGNSFLAEAIREYGIELLLVDLPKELRDKLLKCMKRQNLLE